MSAEQRPTVGLTVHYVSYGTPGGEYASQCRAATVAEVGAWIDVEAIPLPPDGAVMPMRRMLQYRYADACALVVSNPTGMFFNGAVQYHPGVSDAPQRYPGGTWHHICGA
jgi:hypothetical protein